MSRTIAYCRVSSRDQNPQLQLDALHTHGYDYLFAETESGKRGVTIKSLTENFDLDTKEGRFMFAVLAAAAEYELELRAERQAEGIAAARRRQAAGSMLPGKNTWAGPG